MPSLLVTAVENDTIAFRLPDPDGVAEEVNLWCDLDLGDTSFTRVAGGWALDLPLGADGPAVDRFEYLVEVDGVLGLDPGNPLAVAGAFGDHSWLPLPGYTAPAWLADAEVESRRTSVTVAGTAVGVVEAELWSPADSTADEELPLLISHDGPEMDRYGELTRYVATGVATGRLPRMRVALLVPGERNARYAANPAYAAALVDHVVPHLATVAPSPRPPVLMGQSLAALAALHAAWTSPGVFCGLFLQSGSFFTPDLDPQESGFAHWAAVTGFVATVLAAEVAAPGAPVVAVTCGSAEENLANNRLMADHLAATGAEVSWAEVRDSHTWTCWRDLLDPALTDLLVKVWS